MKAVGRVEHPNIVAAMDAGKDQGMHYLVMQYVEGLDLSKLARYCGPLATADACELVRQAALGLQHAHEYGMVHRDVKPSNLILTVPAHSQVSRSADAGGVVKILDLGLALLGEGRPGGAELTSTGQMMGTIDYLAPEQSTSSHQVDIHAGSGNDIVVGGTGNDWIFAGSGNDVAVGGAGNDRIFGGLGNDLLIGGTGRDFIHGGPGKDLMVAGSAENENDVPSLEAALAEWLDNDAPAALAQLGTLIDDGESDKLVGNRYYDKLIAGPNDWLLHCFWHWV